MKPKPIQTVLAMGHPISTPHLGETIHCVVATTVRPNAPKVHEGTGTVLAIDRNAQPPGVRVSVQLEGPLSDDAMLWEFVAWRPIS